MLSVSVRSIVELLLPGGSRGDFDRRSGSPIIDKVPFWPPDLFSVCAYLLEQSDSYTYLQDPDSGSVGSKIKALQKSLEYSGEKWREDPVLPRIIRDEMQSDWEILISSSSSIDEGGGDAEWILAATKLFIIADEACTGIGFYDLSALDGEAEEANEITSSPGGSWVVKAFQLLNSGLIDGERLVRCLKKSRKNTNIFKLIKAEITAPKAERVAVSSAAVLVPNAIACVLPKARTPMTGCTLRSLSHHLSLHPGAGRLRSSWILPPLTERVEEKDFNVLFFPYPYRIENDAFHFHSADDNYGLFDIRQTWLHSRRCFQESIVKTVCRVLEKVSSKDRVDAILLPEAAVDLSTYEAIERRLQDVASSSKPLIFIAGVMKPNERGRLENIAKCSFLFGDDSQVGFEQRKHHRWAIDDAQIEAYGLPSQSQKEIPWWENIQVHGRELNYFVFRYGSCLSTLICEDLARTDPCQSSIRSVGPNMLVALLMDGPQISGRWPERYAMGLADDPGTSVLSVTSQALIRRSNKKYKSHSRTVALWRDCRSGRREIELPRGRKAILVKLKNDPRMEKTLDNRHDEGMADVWTYADHSTYR